MPSRPSAAAAQATRMRRALNPKQEPRIQKMRALRAVKIMAIKQGLLVPCEDVSRCSDHANCSGLGADGFLVFAAKVHGCQKQTACC